MLKADIEEIKAVNYQTGELNRCGRFVDC